MKNKKNKKNSPNRLKCQISGATRMSNATYISDKAYKHQTTSAVWCSFYVSKDSYKELVQYVSDFGFAAACSQYSIDNERLKKWLRYNGRGAFVKIANNIEKEAAELAA